MTPATNTTTKAPRGGASNGAPPSAVTDQYAERLGRLALGAYAKRDRRKVAWSVLELSEREMICRAAFLSPLLAERDWNDLPDDAQDSISVTVRGLARACSRMRGC